MKLTCPRLWSVVRMAIVVQSLSFQAGATASDSTQTRRYAIEVAGIRVGTMTAVWQNQGAQTDLFTLVSDVRVNLLVHTVIVYYKVTNLLEEGKLIRSTVDARTNRGNYTSRTEWQQDHYEIVAEQYKYKHRATQTRCIDFALSSLFFTEPIG